MSTKIKIFKVFRCVYQEHEESAKLQVKSGKHKFLLIFQPEHSMVIFHVLPIRLRFIKRFCWHSFYLKIVISITYWVSTRDTMKKTDTVTALMEFTLWITICTCISITAQPYHVTTTVVKLLLYCSDYSCFPDPYCSHLSETLRFIWGLLWIDQAITMLQTLF